MTLPAMVPPTAIKNESTEIGAEIPSTALSVSNASNALNASITEEPNAKTTTNAGQTVSPPAVLSSCDVTKPMTGTSKSSSQLTTVSKSRTRGKIRLHVPIAICGYSYRLPGGLETDDDFWELLARRGYIQENVEKRYGSGSVPYDGFGTDNPSGIASPFEGLIRDGRELEFDCSLFGISVNDAKRMDPQIKMMLMVTWEALQCAGFDQAVLHNSNTGVFTGIQTSSVSGWRALYGATAGDVPGKSGSMIANRISFHFNWMGPSFSVATACSSGITALDAAVKSLDGGECDLAAFGAVHYLGHSNSSVGFNALGIVSKTGSSRSFDKDANGYMRAEGAFVYLLKRLTDAEHDGDKIFGVIRGCALNTAGAEEDAELLTQGRMIVAPVVHAQRKLMSHVVTATAIDPLTVDYVEAHATGTVLGDAVEGNAISKVYGGQNRKFPLRLASVRSNVGHMEAASFTCSLLKVLLMLQRRQFLPISSHHKECTDKIPFAAKKMVVQTELEEFPNDRTVLIGINSFGFGGANGHCLIEEYRLPENECYSTLPISAPDKTKKVYMIPLSAKSDDALIENARRLGEALRLSDLDSSCTEPKALHYQQQKFKVSDMYTLAGNLSTRMTHHRVRTAVTAASFDELKDKLCALAERADLGQLKPDELTRIQLNAGNDDNRTILERGNILMVFPGQGSQWAGCGRELYETELVFRRVVDAIDAEWIKLSGNADIKLSDIAFDVDIGNKLNECCWAQPVTFLLQVAMYELFLSHGIYPKAVLGHSAGEPSAAYASGAYTLEEACYLVYHRSRLQSLLAGCGRMLVLMLDSTAAEEILKKHGYSGEIEIACYNSPSQTVVCGSEEVILQFREKLEADKMPSGILIAGNIAFHSKHMNPIKDELLKVLSVLDKKGATRRCGSTPMISTVTGKYLNQLNSDYWWSNVRRAVDFLSAITTAEKFVQPQVIIEVSPHITLRSPIRDYYNDLGESIPTYIHTLVRNCNSADLFAQSVGNCFKNGVCINFKKLYPRAEPITHMLPRYAMKLERVIDNKLDDKALTKREHGSAGPLLGRELFNHMSYETTLSKKHYQWMADHIVQGQPLVPAAAYLELIFEAFRGKIIHIESSRCLAPFVLTNEPANVYTEFNPIQYAPNRYDFQVYSRQVENLTDPKIHMCGTLEVITDETVDRYVPLHIPRKITDDKCEYAEVLYKDRSEFYSTMNARIGQSFSYGPFFQGISKVEFDRKKAQMRFDVILDKNLWEAWNKMGYIYHPALLDGALQTFLVYLMESSDFSGIPQMIKNLILVEKPSSEHIIVLYRPPEYIRDGKFHQKGQLAFDLGERSAGNCTIYDGVTGDMIMYMGDYTSFGSNSKLSDLRKVKHYLQWQPKGNCRLDSENSTVVQILSNRYIPDTSGDVKVTQSSLSGMIGVATQALIHDLIHHSHPNSENLFFLNAAEYVIGSAPDQLAMNECLSLLQNAPVQYSLLSSDIEYLSEQYQKFGVNNQDSNLRFVNVNDDPNDSNSFLRPNMFEFILVRINVINNNDSVTVNSLREKDFDGNHIASVSNVDMIEETDERIDTKDKQEFLRIATLAAPGAIILIETACIGKDWSTLIPPTWIPLWKGRTIASNVAIYQTEAFTASVCGNKHYCVEGAETIMTDEHPVLELSEADSLGDSVVMDVSKTSSQENHIGITNSPECIETSAPNNDGIVIVVSDDSGFANYWKTNVRCDSVSFSESAFEHCASWQRVDYFAMNQSDIDDVNCAIKDPELYEGVSKLVEFAKEVIIHRAGCKSVHPCIFTVYTSGAMNNVTSPSQTSIWGAVRSLSMEVGDVCAIDFRLLDVAVKDDLLYAPAVEKMREREMCIHNGALWTSRLLNNRDQMPMTDITSESVDSFRLQTNNSGLLSELTFRVEELPPLGPLEIEVAVKAAALNFRDIMIGLGRLPLLSFEASMLGRSVGMECAGEVVNVGSDVSDFKVGDRVLAMQGGCITNRLKCHEKAAYSLPSNLSFEQGSATSSVYVTAYYALVHLAKMKQGDTILVHSALGGVGQAAIALAKFYGANVYGTAGSEEKRSSLLELGCVGAFDSHSTTWYHDLMAATNGKGVNIVLNSLAGEHVDYCLEALSPGGFHCEIGKVDIFADRPLKMSVFRKNIAFRAIDVDRLMTDDPALTRDLISAVLDLIEKSHVPPLPCTVFSYNEYHDALRYMMNGQHRGKLVLTPPKPGETIRVVDDRKIFGSSNGEPRTILMSGCLGGFGLRVLSYVIAMGGRNIVLMDRDAQRKRSVEWVLDHSLVSFLLGDVEGLRIEILHGDVGVYDDVLSVVKEIKSLNMPPIGSVFHLAGVLDDKKVEDIDRDSLAKVFQPKASGAWNLHRATLNHPTIEHFVMFSSTSSAFGNHGQTNYSAANAYQDGLAAMRRKNGLPALSFCMGAVIEAGMASRSTQLLQMMKASGMPAISCIFAIEALDFAIREGKQWNAVACLAKDLPARFDSTDFLRTIAQLIRNNAAFKMGENTNLSKEALVDILSERVAKLCGIDKLDPTEPFSSYGLNSISVAELATFLKNEMSYTVNAMELMTSATCESIADGIIQAAQGSTDDVEEKESDDGTTSTGLESDSGTAATDESDEIWRTPVVQRQSLFEPTIDEYFMHEPSPLLKRFVEQDIVSFTKVNKNEPEWTTKAISNRVKNLELGTLDGNLPQPCQDQLDELTAFIDKLDVTNVSPENPTKNIKYVLLTGATGFVGRHFIAELLTNPSHYIQKIYCPVRAENDESALKRLIEAMQACGTWNQSFTSRLHVFHCDLVDEYFGLSIEAYKKMTDTIDAVFHFASSLNLAASFNEIRSNNCRSMRAVLRLCLQGKNRKHLFLASTLGIFPQYFCLFTNEFKNKAIKTNEMPEISQMKKIFPLALGGYAWSKLINELIAYKAQKMKGLKLAVFRLPVMFTNSKTGFSVHGDPFVRMFFASLQLRLIPGQGYPLMMEDSAMSNEMMLRIAFNPDRKNTVYNCSYVCHMIQSESKFNDLIGYPCEQTTYNNFKSKCMKLGEDSPINKYWSLLDHFSNYWINFKQFADVYPIDQSTVEEDCFPMPKRLNSVTVFCKSMEWICKVDTRDAPVNVSLLVPSTHLESVLVPSRKLCQRYNLDYDSVVKPHVVEGLRRICDELHARQSILPEVILALTMRLEARVHLHRLLQLYPEIKSQKIDSPLFILGLNRTGTTFLHRMLEASGLFETPHPEDQLALPSAEQIIHSDTEFATSRLAAISSFLESYAVAADGIHEVELGVAEEDMVAHACSFMSLEYDILYDLPKYRKWLESQALDVVYEEHRTWMQFVAWWRMRQNPNCGSRWCYKFPWHLNSLNLLLKAYPDAKFVHTHRSIHDVAPSWCSLVKSQRSRFIDDIDDHQLGRDQLQSLSQMIAAGYEYRKSHPEHDEKWLDVHYNEIVAAPADIAKRIITHAGLPVTLETVNKINLFVKQSMARRDAITLHSPKYQDFGFSSEDFDTNVFKSYDDKSRSLVTQILRAPKVLSLSVSSDQILMAGLAFGAGVAAALLARPTN